MSAELETDYRKKLLSSVEHATYEIVSLACRNEPPPIIIWFCLVYNGHNHNDKVCMSVLRILVDSDCGLASS